MDAMTPLDAAFLALEDADPNAGLHIGSVGIFEGPPPSHARFVAGMERKLSAVPRYRQRLRTVPLSLGPPVWVDDPEFDIAYHARRTALPAPGDDAQLRRLVGRVMSHRLDRGKPMWEAWVIEGMTGNRWALLSKVHHCLVDGISGTDLLATMLDLSADAPLPPAVPWQPRGGPSSLRLVADAVGRQAVEPLRLGAALARSARSPRSALTSAGRFARGAAQYVGAVRPIEETSLWGPVSPHRRVRWAKVSMDDIAAIRERHGGSVNDVALAAVCYGLRELLLTRHEEPGRHAVRTLVPVSTRARGEESIRDNRVSAMLLDLPVHLCDPVEQLHAIRHDLGRLRWSGEPAAGAALTRASAHVPYGLLAPLLRMAFRFPQHQLTTVTTNVPGPPFPLYAFGSRMVEAYPYVPVADRLRLGIAMFSYCGEMTFGITSDAAKVPDADVLVTGIENGFARLLGEPAKVSLSVI